MKLTALFLGIIIGAVAVFFWILDYGLIIARGTDEDIAILERRLSLHSQDDEVEYPGEKITNFNAPGNFVVLIWRDRHRNVREFFAMRGGHDAIPFLLGPIFEEGQYWFIDSFGIDIGFVNLIAPQEVINRGK